MGCEGGVQNTTAVVPDVPTTPTISTTPGATEKVIAKYEAHVHIAYTSLEVLRDILLTLRPISGPHFNLVPSMRPIVSGITLQGRQSLLWKADQLANTD